MGVYFDELLREAIVSNSRPTLTLSEYHMIDINGNIKEKTFHGWYDGLTIKLRPGQRPLLIERKEKHPYLVLAKHYYNNFAQDHIVMPNNQKTYIKGVGLRVPTKDHFCDIGVFYCCNNSIICNVKPDGHLRLYVCLQDGNLLTQELNSIKQLHASVNDGQYDNYLSPARINYLRPENFNYGQWKDAVFDFQSVK